MSWRFGSWMHLKLAHCTTVSKCVCVCEYVCPTVSHSLRKQPDATVVVTAFWLHFARLAWPNDCIMSLELLPDSRCLLLLLLVLLLLLSLLAMLMLHLLLTLCGLLLCSRKTAKVAAHSLFLQQQPSTNTVLSTRSLPQQTAWHTYILTIYMYKSCCPLFFYFGKFA